MNKIKKIILLLISIILVTTFLSGCVNPIEKVPVITINVTYAERQGVVDADRFLFIQDSVNYIDRPKRTQAESFPAIIGRATIVKKIKGNEKVNETIIGPWEAIPYKGNGSYRFSVGFNNGNYPESGDEIHISVIVVDKSGQRIGYIIQDFTWK